MNEITQDMGVKQAAIAARRHKSGKAASFCMSFGMLPFERTGKKTLNVKKGAYQVRTHLPGLSLRTSAHTCGNPFSPQGSLASWLLFGQIRDALRIRLKRCFLPCTAAGVTDCPIAPLLAMTCRNLLRVRKIPGHCRCTAGKRPCTH